MMFVAAAVAVPVAGPVQIHCHRTTGAKSGFAIHRVYCHSRWIFRDIPRGKPYKNPVAVLATAAATGHLNRLPVAMK